MLLSKAYGKVSDPEPVFIFSVMGAILLAGIAVGLTFGSDLFGYVIGGMGMFFIGFFAFMGCAFATEKNDDLEFFKILASFFLMSLLFFGLGFGLLHGLWSGLSIYYLPLGILVEEVLYWIDDSQLPPTADKYMFTIQKKLEAFSEILLGFGVAGVIFAIVTEASSIIPTLEGIGLVLGIGALIVGFVWLNALKWKKPVAAQTPSQDHSTR